MIYFRKTNLETLSKPLRFPPLFKRGDNVKVVAKFIAEFEADDRRLAVGSSSVPCLKNEADSSESMNLSCFITCNGVCVYIYNLDSGVPLLVYGTLQIGQLGADFIDFDMHKLNRIKENGSGLPSLKCGRK